tara:strand:+ start:5417 stop:5830 length:414 start_codon:yes stop_codon:yes gene_type:complete
MSDNNNLFKVIFIDVVGFNIAAFLVPKNQGLQFKKLLEVLHEKQAYKDWVKDKPPYIQYKYADPNDKLIILRDPDEQLIENIFEKSLVLRKTHNDNEIDTIFIQLIPSEKKKRKSELSNAPDNSGMKSTPNKRKFKF